MYTLIVGVTCKIIMNYILVGIPGINIHGGPFASIICYSASMIPNLYFVCKYAHLSFNLKEWVIKPAIAAFAMGIIVWGLRTLLPLNRVFTILEVATGIAIYSLTAIKLGIISADELSIIKRRLGRKRESK